MIARFGRRWLPAFASTLLTVTLVQTLPASAADDPTSPRTDVNASASRAPAGEDAADQDAVEPDNDAWWLDEPGGSNTRAIGPDEDAWWLDDAASTLASAAGSLEDSGATDVTDGLPVAPVGAGDGDEGQAVEVLLLPDRGVAPRVTSQASDGDRVPVIIRLREQVDMAALGEQAAATGLAAALDKRTELRGRGLSNAAENRRVAEAGQDARAAAVVRSLRSFAGDRRAPVAGLLEQLHANGHARNVQRYWVFSGFSASVDSQALTRLERHPDVASVTLDGTIEAPEIEPEQGPKLPTWGLEAVHATDVWSDYDDRGEGVVVGIMDSGVDGSHPALANSWRGNTDDPAKSWYVATGEDYPTPGDGGGHGTHVMGTMVGGPPGEVIGVAPEATWIAAKIFNDFGSATTSGIHRGFQWMLAPGGDPTAAPDLVNNSWGSAATYNPEYWYDVDAWVAAGIVPIFANGNDGPG
ncbi:MAG: S8 family serine peptidase, partial [Nocardioidaceae bacterium]